MTQAKRRGNGQKKPTQLGTLSVVVLVVILFLVRNYASSTNELVTQPTAQLAAQTTEPLAETPAKAGDITENAAATNTVVEIAAIDSTAAEKAKVENTPVESTSAESTPLEIALVEKPVVANSESQQSNLPPLVAAGSEPEKKKATRTPKPRATLTPTLVKRSTVTSTPTVKRATATATPTPKRSRSQSGLPLIYYDDLPKEAQQTIRLIDKGGPFPYSRDGIEFQNREGILPRKSRGYYSEYTVITPGSSDRGARRIVEGQKGELYYTDDHYDSFKEVAR